MIIVIKFLFTRYYYRFSCFRALESFNVTFFPTPRLSEGLARKLFSSPHSYFLMMGFRKWSDETWKEKLLCSSSNDVVRLQPARISSSEAVRFSAVCRTQLRVLKFLLVFLIQAKALLWTHGGMKRNANKSVWSTLSLFHPFFLDMLPFSFLI